jgi:diacylglycerol O-acyltransferase / wax synthase
MHRMSPQDASFLHVEDAVSHMHIGSVCTFEGPAPSHEEILRAVEAKLPLVPRYRQKVRFVPLSLGRPVWVDDAHFVLDYHVRHTALPAPGGDRELRNLVGRVMSQQLDRVKPLWELWVAEGLEDNRWAVISKTHHCMVDGVASTDLMTVLFDDTREGTPAGRDPWRPEAEPNPAQLVTQALAERAASPYEGVRTMAAAARGPRRVLGNVVRGARGVSRTATLLRPTPPTSLNGPIGPHRRWDWARGRLSDVKTIRQGLGGTVNDVVLAAITAGFRELLGSRGELAEDRFVRTLVPVSIRAQSERGTYNNKVSALFAELPVCIADPVERLDSVRAQMEGLKQSGQAVGGEVLTSLSGFAPAMLLALGGRVATRMPQRNVNTVTTNVPGPQSALYFSGRRMLEAFPYVPLGSHVRVGVAIFSYDGALNFGVTGDYDTSPDIEVLCRGIESGLGELLGLAQQRAGTDGAAKRRPAPKRRPRATTPPA